MLIGAKDITKTWQTIKNIAEHSKNIEKHSKSNEALQIHSKALQKHNIYPLTKAQNAPEDP